MALPGMHPIAGSSTVLPTTETIIANYPTPTVLLGPSYRVLQASDRYLRHYGLVAHECIGTHFFDLVNKFQLIPNAEILRPVMEKALATQQVYATSDVTGEDGSFWTLHFTPIIKDGRLHCTIFSLQDTTTDQLDRRFLNDQLDANDTLRILVESVKEYAIFVIDTGGYVKTWNRGAALLKGYSHDEIVGKHFSTFYGPEDIAAGKPEKELEIALREGKVEDESWRFKKDGSKFWANVVITPMYREFKHIGFSKVTRDLTERKAAEVRVIDAYKESDKLKSAFLANISHEIRTPLNGLMVSLDLLVDTPLNDQAQECAGIMKESASILAHTINDVLDFSKLESGGFSLDPSTINIQNITTIVIRGLRPTLKPGVLLESTFADNLPTSIKGDALRFRQVLQNLVANAIKFTDAGSISTHISIKSEDETSYVILTEVTDTGIGICSTEVRTLFNRFSQIDPSTTKKYQGTGLGLAISKGLAELMGGAIGYHSNPVVKGSVFWFTIKAEKVHITTPSPFNSISNTLSSNTLLAPLAALHALASSKRILLAEDNPINLRVMTMLLKSLSFTKITTCLNGAEAVLLIKQNKLIYDLVLMDISMPVMDGQTATIEIRRAGIGIPIIAMTANALKGDVEGYLEKGMNAYISKPVDRGLLVETLLKWLK